jgi:CCR4-Not complex component, Not1
MGFIDHANISVCFSFSFAWLELLCHKNFMPKILNSNSPKGWQHFQRLLVCLFKFVEPFLRKSQLPEPVCCFTTYYVFHGNILTQGWT